MLSALASAFVRCLQSDYPWQEKAEARLLYRGRSVCFKRGIGENELIRGKLAGLTTQGYLILETAAGQSIEPSGELCAVEGDDKHFH
jgi:hypothetical protein